MARVLCIGDAQQIVGPEPREATFASSVIRLSCSVAPWPGQLRRSASTLTLGSMNSLQSQGVDGAGLRKLYRSDPTARLVLDSFAARQNKATLTTVTSLMSILAGA